MAVPYPERGSIPPNGTILISNQQLAIETFVSLHIICAYGSLGRYQRSDDVPCERQRGYDQVPAG